MTRKTQIIVLSLLIMMVGSGCESISYQTHEGAYPVNPNAFWQRSSMIPIYGVGVGASWSR